VEATLTRARYRGALGGLLAGVGFFGGIAAAKATEKTPYPRPGCEPEEVRVYFTESATAARLSAAGLALSTAALATFSGTVTGLAGRAEAGSGVLRAAALVGGGFAVATQATSTLATVAATLPAIDTPTIVRLREAAFMIGGPVHGVGLGVLVGALGLAGLSTGELSRALATASLATAPVCILGPLTLAAKPTMIALPIGHAIALVVSAVAGTGLAITRRRS
jgi:hypothetical protein